MHASAYCSFHFLLFSETDYSYSSVTYCVCNEILSKFQSEKSADMFSDDIFGESPTGVRKTVSVMLVLTFFTLKNSSV